MGDVFMFLFAYFCGFVMAWFLQAIKYDAPRRSDRLWKRPTR